jgi:hypothetical protein
VTAFSGGHSFVVFEGQMVRFFKKLRNNLKFKENRSMRELNENQKQIKVRKGQNRS